MITNINNEFSTLLQLIDYDIDHLRTLNKGYSELDRYQDIKAYNHNIITINNIKIIILFYYFFKYYIY